MSTTNDPSTAVKNACPHHCEIVTCIKGILEEKEIVPLMIVIVGSHGKQMASEHSDYDTIVVGMHACQDYLLQKVKGSRHFETQVHIDEDNRSIEIEGTVYDVLKMQNYILGNNNQAYEAFAGTCIYSTPVSESLRVTWLQVYQAQALSNSLRGMLHGYKSKKLSKVGSSDEYTSRKLAGEAAYLALKLYFLRTNQQTPPPFSVHDLLRATSVPNEDKKWIKALVEARIAETQADFHMSKQFLAFLVGALDSSTEVGTKRSSRTLEMAREQMEDLFLEQFVAITSRNP